MGFLCPMWKFIREVSREVLSCGFSFIILLFLYLKGSTKVAVSEVLDPLMPNPRCQVQDSQLKLKKKKDPENI